MAGTPHSFGGDRTRGALLGLAVADALGAPLESRSPEEASAAARQGLEMTGGGGWQPGESTDDTALALCLAESVADHGLLDLDDVCGRYIAWADSSAKGIGTITRIALQGARDADDARGRARRHHERHGMTAGNGTIMRAAPIGLAAASAAEASRYARDDAVLTHFDPVAGAASAALCSALIALGAGDEPLDAAGREAAGHDRLEEAAAVARGGDRAAAAALAASPEAATCWTTLAVALCALVTSESYEEGVTWAISLGGDTDTNAAVAGALLGYRDGIAALPDRWLEPLLQRDRIERAAEALVVR